MSTITWQPLMVKQPAKKKLQDFQRKLRARNMSDVIEAMTLFCSSRDYNNQFRKFWRENGYTLKKGG